MTDSAMLKAASDSQTVELNDALDGLEQTEPQKAKLIRMMLHGESIDDIAAEFGIGKATAYEWRRKGLNELRRILEDT